MPANTHLAEAFDQLNMPAMSRAARSGRDMSRAIGALVWYSGPNEQIRGEAIMVRVAAEKDGYSIELESAFMATQWIRMPYTTTI